MFQLNFHQQPQISGDHINQSPADRCGEGRDVGVRHLPGTPKKPTVRKGRVSRSMEVQQNQQKNISASEYRPFDPEGK